ncbi:hypothetical protein [Streptomyces sp. NPDC058674]|uniref:hypothetical protein n=1 Tax=Streptomyces sp. NPDC058674 TaxID=3346592 RepID=UPI00365C4820
MSAPTHTRSLPHLPTLPSGRPLPSGPRAAAAVAGRVRSGAGRVHRGVGRVRSGADARLHWWALALPALAFGLLLLLAGSGEARAATADGDGPALVQVAGKLLRAVG